ncbi:MAG: helix-turn-helix domain-containing protein [Deltaproteobacteria bacterium]|nr:helix-turn-helix domain-containing protein [Candidatus Zymogenaceae bacterium]
MSKHAYEGYSYQKARDCRDQFVPIPINLVKTKKHLWSEMSPAERAVYPALLLHRQGGEIFPSLKRLCRLSGRARSTVIEGLKGLEERGIIAIRKEPMDSRGAKWRKNRYCFSDTFLYGKKWTMPAQTLLGRGWASLSSSAQAIYIALGAMSYQIEPDRRFPEKLYVGLAKLSYTEITDYAGVSRSYIKRYLGELMEWDFIEDGKLYEDDFPGLGACYLLKREVKILPEKSAKGSSHTGSIIDNNSSNINVSLTLL